MGIKRRRISAFVLDMFIVLFLSISVSDLSYLNPYKEQYNTAAIQYNEVYDEFALSLLTEGSTTSEEALNELIPQLHKIEKYNIFSLIWYLVFYFLYFIVFAYFNNGQTLGKKLFNLKVVDKNENKASIIRYIVRSLFNGSNLYLGINIIIILQILITFINDSFIFYNLYTILRYLGLFIEIALFITFVVKKNNQALDDMIGGTRVISTK